MMRLGPRWLRRAAAGVVLLGGAALLCLVVPSVGQQPTPEQPDTPLPRVSLPAAVTRRVNARATLDFTLPTGIQLVRVPRLRVNDAKDELVELLPTELERLAPTVLGFRELHTENYLPGTYRIRAEVDYRRGGSPEATVVSPWLTFTVPAQ
jgi:hypothetical protein